MKVICSYKDWVVVLRGGKLYHLDFEDNVMAEVKEVYRVRQDKVNNYTEFELMDGVPCPHLFAISGEEDTTKDYCYWAFA